MNVRWWVCFKQEVSSLRPVWYKAASWIKNTFQPHYRRRRRKISVWKRSVLGVTASLPRTWVSESELRVIEYNVGQAGNSLLYDYYTLDRAKGQTWRMTLSGWLKLGVLDRAFPLPAVEGQRPRSFLPHVRTLRKRENRVRNHPTSSYVCRIWTIRYLASVYLCLSSKGKYFCSAVKRLIVIKSHPK